MIRTAAPIDARRPPWLVEQRWEQLLFAHWPVNPEELRPLLPAGVEPDVRDERAWLGIVAFVMVGTRAPFGPAWSALAPIPELNVRTYVRVGGVPAVWFLSLDAASPLFVTMGRSLYGLRYRVARMVVTAEADRIHYLSSGDGSFAATYGPEGPPRPAKQGSLEHFLVERYRLFALRRGRLITAVVQHEPWPLQPASVRIDLNTMAPQGVAFAGEPLMHFARCVHARISAPRSVGTVFADEGRAHSRHGRRGAARSRRPDRLDGTRVPADAT